VFIDFSPPETSGFSHVFRSWMFVESEFAPENEDLEINIVEK